MKKFIIFSKDNCQFCLKAVSLLTIKRLEFLELKLDKDFDREYLLELFPQAKTFPQIKLDDGEIIGGFKELEEFLNSKGL